MEVTHNVLSSRSLMLLILVTFLGASAQQPTQDQGAKFKVETNNVVVDVIVTDKHGNVVRGLKKEAFRVYEDEKEQPLSSFSERPTSGSDQSGAGQGASIQTSPTNQDRFITVVLDLGDNQKESIVKSCEAVLRYLQRVKTDDTSVAIYYVDHGLQLALPFSNDFKDIAKALDEISRQVSRGRLTDSDRADTQDQINELFAKAYPGSRYGSIGGQTSDSTGVGARSGPADAFTAQYKREIDTLRAYLKTQNTFQAKAVFVALRALALSYSDLPGRKNIVFFSEGFNFSSEARGELDAVIEAANRSNVSFYVIDPAGLVSGGSSAASRWGANTRAAQMTAIAEEGIGQRGGESKFDRIRDVGTETETLAQLGNLADATGGLLVKNTNDLEPALRKVLDETRSFYMLGYSPAEKTTNGAFRKIKITVSGDYKLRYRKGYWAVPRAAGIAMTPMQAHLFSAARQGLLRSDSSPSVKANIALARDGKYYVPVSVAVPAKMLPTKSELANGKELTLIAFAYDENGNIVSGYERHWDVARPEKFNEGATVTMQGQIPVQRLGPLRVQAIVQSPNGRFNIGEARVELQATPESAPALSSVILTNEAEAGKCGDLTEALCIGSVRLRQPAELEFPKASKLFAYLGSADLKVDAATKQPRVAAEFSIKSGEKQLGSVPLQNIQASPGPVPGSVFFMARLNLNALPTGKYTLVATVHDLVSNKTSSQKAEFTLQ
jgi:VWFA-related protein